MADDFAGVFVDAVQEGSIAAELGIEPGDAILRINGQPLRDEIDYMYVTGGENDLRIEWSTPEGAEFEAAVEKEPEEDLGLILRPLRVRTCANRCTFCFVDQMPGGMRPTLYVKDDDWRSSFLYGTYVTLTNLQENDFERIIEQHISPLYVSVHATDDDVRVRLLGTERGRGILRQLRRLADAEIVVHAQVVVAEGVNDGTVLEQTIDDLFSLHPSVSSLSVVPVGLTHYRDELAPVAAVSPQNAGRILDIIEDRQAKHLQQAGTRFVFAADELYLRSGRQLPPSAAYEDFSQIENGVGLVADFEHRAGEALSRVSGKTSGKVLLLTGRAFFPRLAALAERVQDVLGLQITVKAVDNTFFGPQVTVAGLLTGSDLMRTLDGAAASFDAVFVPETMFRDAGHRTLDDVCFEEIADAAGIPCFKASAQGDEFIRQLQCLQLNCRKEV